MYMFSPKILDETTIFELTFQLNSFMLDMRGNITLSSFYFCTHGEDVLSTILISFLIFFVGRYFCQVWLEGVFKVKLNFENAIQSERRYSKLRVLTDLDFLFWNTFSPCRIVFFIPYCTEKGVYYTLVCSNFVNLRKFNWLMLDIFWTIQ